MSIIKQISGGSPMTSQILATKQDFETASSPVEEDDSTAREGDECAILKIFVDPSFPNDVYRNDKFSIIGKKALFASTVSFELWKDGAKIADLNDNTYGTFYPVNTWIVADGFTSDQAKQSGYQGEWLKVYNLHGYGCYNIVKITTLFGQTFTDMGCSYRLMEFSTDEADETVKIEAFQNGYIIDQKIDYTGLEWFKHYRLEGFFGLPKRNNDEQWFVNKVRDEEQIQQNIRKDFTFEPFFVPKCIQPEVDEILSANYQIFTDYNLTNAYDIRRLQTKWKGEEDTRYFEGSKKEAPVFVFTELSKARLKRNVR